MFKEEPTGYQAYLEMILNVFKTLHPEKTKGTIFNGSNTNSSGRKDPNVMEVDRIGSGKQKESSSSEKVKSVKFCTWCDEHDRKRIAKSHNTADCRQRKAASEEKKPQPNRNAENPPRQQSGDKSKYTPKKYTGNNKYKARAAARGEEVSDDSEDYLDRADLLSLASDSSYRPG